MLSILQDYALKKTDGLVTAVKSDEDIADPKNITYVIIKKQWDSNTGVEMADIAMGIEKQELLTKRKSLVDQIASIDAFLADIDPDTLSAISKV